MTSLPPSDSTNEKFSADQQFQIEQSTFTDAQIGGVAGGDINQAGGDIHQTTTQNNYNANVQQFYAPPQSKRSDDLTRLITIAQEQHIDLPLRKSLFNLNPITLTKLYQPRQVIPQFQRVLAGDDEPHLSPDAPILDVFDEFRGKLLILGQPGAGKSTVLLQLAQDLLHRARQDETYPVAVLFSLDSWKPKQSMADWLITELDSKYGVRADLGKAFLEDHRLVVLLDGLDEQRFDQQQACIHAINELLCSSMKPDRLVVCCRREEYRQLIEQSQTRLQLNGAIELQPLRDDQIRDYITQFPHSEQLNALIENDATRNLIRTPLLLSVACIACKRISLRELQKLSTSDARLQYLLGVYIERMFDDYQPKNIQFARQRQQTRRWLTFIARNLQRENKIDFLIENLQASWMLDSSLKKQYRYVGVLIFSPVGMLTGLLIGTLGGAIGITIVLSVVGALTGACIGVQFEEKIIPVESLQWSWRKFQLEGSSRITSLLPVAVLIGLILGIFSSESRQVHRFIIDVLIGLLIGLLIGTFTSGLSTLPLEIRSQPNEGIIQSWHMMRKGAVVCAIFLLIVSALFWIRSGTQPESIVWVFGAMLGGGLFGAQKYGGEACLKHWLLRRMLFKHGYAPWDYATFLDYATDMRFMQRLGGRYRFMHITLRDYFANLSL